MERESLGSFIANRRKELSMSQAELAGKVFLSPQAISSIERTSSSLSIDNALLFCQALDITLEDLLERRIDPSRKPTPFDRDSLPSKLEAARLQKNLTRKEIARKAGLSEKSIRNYETGRQVPSIQYLESLLGVLGIGFSDLIQGHVAKKRLAPWKLALIVLGGLALIGGTTGGAIAIANHTSRNARPPEGSNTSILPTSDSSQSQDPSSSPLPSDSSSTTSFPEQSSASSSEETPASSSNSSEEEPIPSSSEDQSPSQSDSDSEASSSQSQASSEDQSGDSSSEETPASSSNPSEDEPTPSSSEEEQSSSQSESSSEASSQSQASSEDQSGDSSSEEAQDSSSEEQSSSQSDSSSESSDSSGGDEPEIPDTTVPAAYYLKDEGSVIDHNLSQYRYWTFSSVSAQGVVTATYHGTASKSCDIEVLSFGPFGHDVACDYQIEYSGKIATISFDLATMDPLGYYALANVYDDEGTKTFVSEYDNDWKRFYYFRAAQIISSPDSATFSFEGADGDGELYPEIPVALSFFESDQLDLSTLKIIPSIRYRTSYWKKLIDGIYFSNGTWYWEAPADAHIGDLIWVYVWCMGKDGRYYSLGGDAFFTVKE